MSTLDGDKDFSPYNPRGKLFGFVWFTSPLIARFICVVTGAGAKKAVGRSTVFELAAHGVACVYACDMDDSNFDDLIAQCKEQYPSTEACQSHGDLC
jgi:hypothetical protein